MNKRLSIEQQTIAQSYTVQSGLAQMLDLMDEQSKLIKLIQALTQENEQLRIQLQECQIGSASPAHREKAKTYKGISIE